MTERNTKLEAGAIIERRSGEHYPPHGVFRLEKNETLPTFDLVSMTDGRRFRNVTDADPAAQSGSLVQPRNGLLPGDQVEFPSGTKGRIVSFEGTGDPNTAWVTRDGGSVGLKDPAGSKRPAGLPPKAFSYCIMALDLVEEQKESPPIAGYKAEVVVMDDLETPVKKTATPAKSARQHTGPIKTYTIRFLTRYRTSPLGKIEEATLTLDPSALGDPGLNVSVKNITGVFGAANNQTKILFKATTAPKGFPAGVLIAAPITDVMKLLVGFAEGSATPAKSAMLNYP